MSNVVLDAPRVNGQPKAMPSVENAPSEQGFDIVQILWRWKWLPIMGSLVGAGLGLLYFSRQPATFEAQALVQLVNSAPTPSGFSFVDPMHEINKSFERPIDVIQVFVY